MLSGINRFTREGGHLEHIGVVIYGDKSTYDGFTKSLKSKSYERATAELGGRDFDPHRWKNEMETDLMANDMMGIGKKAAQASEADQQSFMQRCSERIKELFRKKPVNN